MMKNKLLMKALPWLLIFGGLYSLTMLPAIIAGGCILIGITILFNKLWPEKWCADNEKINDESV